MGGTLERIAPPGRCWRSFLRCGLIRIHRERAVADRNTYALVATIELGRNKEGNPPVPSWLEADYFRAISELAEIGLTELTGAADHELLRGILSVIAISKGMRTPRRILLNCSDEELVEMGNRLFD